MDEQRVENEAEGYIPGSCNLGRDEVRHRMRMGYLGLVLTVIVFVVLEILDSPRVYRIFVFPPIFYALSGFLQARHRFCYAYGWFGVFSMIGRRKLHRVTDQENARKDRMTALKIVIMVLMGSVLLTGLYMVI